MCSNDEQKEMYTVVFTMDAIDIIKKLAECLEPHAPIRFFMDLIEPIVLPELERIFEQKLAMYISLNIKNSEGKVYTINVDDVTREVTKLIQNVLHTCNKRIPPEGTRANMLDGYPLFLLSQTCNTNMSNAHIMGECMRRFIQIRKTYKRWMPIDLQMCTISNCDLIGAPGSPLVQSELQALYRYLGAENRMYVTMLLNCLFELGEQEKFLGPHYMNQWDIIKVCKSSWLCLFMSTVILPERMILS